VNKRIRSWSIFLHREAKFLRKFHLGNPDQNLYDTGRIFIQQIQKDEIAERAGTMAFSFTLALFPLLLFLLNLVPYLGLFSENITTENILLFVAEFLPESIYQEAESTILDIVSKPRQSLLSIGFFLALYLSTNGAISMMKSFNAVYKTRENRGVFKTRIVATSIIIVLVLALFGASLVMIVGSNILYKISEWEFVSANLYYYSLTTFRFFVLLSLFVIATAFIFRFAPVVQDKWRFFSIGSVLAGLLITLSFYLFSFYLNNFATYNKLYGSIGTMIAVMFWLYIASLLILVCFEINVSLDKVAHIRPVSKGNIFQRIIRGQINR
jgi:membrane protein